LREEEEEEGENLEEEKLYHQKQFKMFKQRAMSLLGGGSSLISVSVP